MRDRSISNRRLMSARSIKASASFIDSSRNDIFLLKANLLMFYMLALFRLFVNSTFLPSASAYKYGMAVIWFIMIAVSLGLMLFTDPASAVNAMISGAHGAVELSLNLLALYAFWLGFFSLIDKLGLSRGLERLLRPVITRLFPSASGEARKYITMNMSANLLGLGNAATPMAINAIKLMDDGKSTKASTDMIMLTVISATSLQLLPTTVIGMRATAGSVNPSDFLFPSLVATVLSTLIGIIGVKLCAAIFDRPKTKKKSPKNSEAPKRAESRAFGKRRLKKHAADAARLTESKVEGRT